MSGWACAGRVLLEGLPAAGARAGAVERQAASVRTCWACASCVPRSCIADAQPPGRRCRQAIKRAHEHHLSSAQLEGLEGEEDSAAEDAELGVRLHPSYPASLEREGFVGSSRPPTGAANGSSSGSQYSHLPSSPEFELKAVVSNGSSSAVAAATAAARDKAARLLSSGSGLLTVTAASGSGGQLVGTPTTGGAPHSRSASLKLKISPQTSMDRLDSEQVQRRYSLAEGGGEDGDAAASARAVRRHASSSGEGAL